MTGTIAWRLVPARHQLDAFTGDGARIAGGRWNMRGTRAVYLASSLALAAGETMFYTGGAVHTIPYVVFRVEIPQEIQISALPLSDLPSTWRVEPPPESVKRMGTEWVVSGVAAVLRVPSVLFPAETNYLVNPAHKDFHRLKISKPESFSFNPRMWKS
jgi:RES domain-containing protein